MLIPLSWKKTGRVAQAPASPVIGVAIELARRAFSLSYIISRLMPRELPGLYWDESRNRYFPLSSKPKAAPAPSATIASLHSEQKSAANPQHAAPKDTSNPNEKVKRRRFQYHTDVLSLSPECSTRRLKEKHELLLHNVAASSRMSFVSVPTMGPIRSFRSTVLDGKTWRFIGDAFGWLYSDKDFMPEQRRGVHYWSADLNIQHSNIISSICTSGPYCVSTCLGPGKMAVQNLRSPERMFLLNLHAIHDIRTSCLLGPKLVLGASKKAVFLPDIDYSGAPQFLHTQGDVFSVAQQENLVFTGTRNGTVERFDMRLPQHRSQKLFDARFGTAQRSSVLHLELVGDSEVLLSHLNGDLVSFDVRFSRSGNSPLKVFEGHVNMHTQRLGIAVDHEHDLVFAAGQDCRIRGWSLRTGAPMQPPPSSSGQPVIHRNNPLLATLPGPAPSLQITNEPGDAGLSLWAAVDYDLYQFHLGQRMGAGMIQ
ncbi:hypothetical protein D9619_007379 [Psilocybe cf. subviscida]|uniref:Uncharacterized protein n=1 Tax=Psilocybe cf. subviscida TaxID=2480587 RepID=A0A8H5B1R3_9AGAR|nr:hypothetical protein D9619_007379 [Psilocybe cf. subviscida]